jgi:hypothetical protein
MDSASQAPQAAPGHMVEQKLSWHPSPRPQTSPHPPQFAGSLCRSVQLPLQSVKPGKQAAAHALPSQHKPPWQAMPSRQELPQLPQFPGSLWTSTHLPLQLARPAAQPARQKPFEHLSSTLQTCPQPPQFSGSVAESTQVPLHSNVPDSQVLWRVDESPQLAGKTTMAENNKSARRARMGQEPRSRIEEVPPQADRRVAMSKPASREG